MLLLLSSSQLPVLPVTDDNELVLIERINSPSQQKYPSQPNRFPLGNNASKKLVYNTKLLAVVRYFPTE
jgi:hypothetical protein